MQFTLTIAGLTASAAEALERSLEDALVPPVATSRNEINEGKGLWDLVAYFNNEQEACAAAERFLGDQRIAIAPLPDADWVRRSLEGLPPVAAGRFYLYGSHDRHKRRSGGISLEIDAGTAFGTGHHATTLGCLLALDGLLKRKKPRRILDIGCGTGVLALAAAKALHIHVLASDIDPEAIRVARANACRNAVSPLLRTVTAPGLDHPHIRAGTPYDLILANILARPLVNLSRSIADALAQHGTLILSGLTRDQSRPVLAAYRDRGLIAAGAIAVGSWATLVLVRQAR